MKVLVVGPTWKRHEEILMEKAMHLYVRSLCITYIIARQEIKIESNYVGKSTFLQWYGAKTQDFQIY
jgi:hypothetical protein